MLLALLIRAISDHHLSFVQACWTRASVTTADAQVASHLSAFVTITTTGSTTSNSISPGDAHSFVLQSWGPTVSHVAA